MAKQFNDLGLGNKARRLINQDGSFNVIRKGQTASFINTYQQLIKMPWIPFLLLTLLFVFIINCLFASIYYAIGVDHFNGIAPGSLTDEYLKCLFFSFQTFTTVGYGHISPIGNLTSLLAAFEALTGLMVFAIITGLLYGRFAKPTAKFLYSNNLLVSPFGQSQSLQFRIVNKRKSMIMDMRATLLVSFKNIDGSRSYRQLELEREAVVLFPLNWTIVHPITEQSPLFDKSKERLVELDAEFIVVLKGYDDSFSQEIHSIFSYSHKDMIWNAKFNLMYESLDDGSTVLHVDRLSDYTLL